MIGDNAKLLRAGILLLLVSTVSCGQQVDNGSENRSSIAPEAKETVLEGAGSNVRAGANDGGIVPRTIKRYIESELGIAPRVRIVREPAHLQSPLVPAFLSGDPFAFAGAVPTKTDLYLEVDDGEPVAKRLLQFASEIEVGERTLSPDERQRLKDAREVLYERDGKTKKQGFEKYLKLIAEAKALKEELEQEERREPPNRAAISNVDLRVRVNNRELSKRSTQRDKWEEALEDIEDLQVDSKEWQKSANAWKDLVENGPAVAADPGVFAELSGWVDVDLPINDELVIATFDANGNSLKRVLVEKANIALRIKKFVVDHSGGALRSQFLQKRFWRAKSVLSDGPNNDGMNELLPRYVRSLVLAKEIEFSVPSLAAGDESELMKSLKSSSSISIGGLTCAQNDYSSLFLSRGYIAFSRPIVVAAEVVETPLIPNPDSKYFRN